ncbi:MAG TPA: formate--tetrahydrofolate ligase [Planctomycetota bacterium]|nr:formate--tetrahydrofolate ligase [Planctomycetota bacterium]
MRGSARTGSLHVLHQEIAVLSDLDIAQAAKLRPIEDIAKEAGIRRDELELYGDYKAKVKLEILDRLKDRPVGKLIDVTAITPTPLGEGKTVTTVGLGQGLKHIGKKAFTCIRQPSLGPVFGIKGGAAGGGYSQIIPMEDFNLHLTGDIHAISIAHNLCAAFLDNALKRDNKFNIDPRNVLWRRVVDLNDRWALEKVVTGLGEGFVRETGFDISVASEIMAILGLTTSLKDMRERIGRAVVAFTYDEKPVTTEDLKVAGAMTVLMKDAIKPNLMQNLEGGPAFVHAGPFANIAHGNSSILADQIALRLADYVVTESGFGADIGMEKFFDIKCRIGGLRPSCVVIVASMRALKMHSGKFKVVAGKPLDPALIKENPKAVAEGCVNLAKHIENVKLFGVPSVVVINRFTYDAPSEIEVVKQKALEAGAETVVEHMAWADGGKGAAALAEAVVAASQKPGKFQFLYPDSATIKEKIEAIATKVYGAAKVEYLPEANRKIKLFQSLGWGKLPICMAKTHLSISHDPAVKGAPKGYTFPVRDVRASVGAGFLYPLCGDMRTIPGLPSKPAGEAVDIDDKGNVVGLF